MPRRPLFYVVLVAATLLFSELSHPLAALRADAQGGCQTFPETGKTVCGKFLDYWKSHGGLAQQGYPLSNSFQEKSELDGKTYTVQYFERAVFEDHPENQPPYDVLLSQLGTFQFKRKYPGGDPSTGGTQPAPAPAATQPPASGQEYDIVPPSTRLNSIGDLEVFGVIKYNGTVERGTATIVVTLSDNSGKVLATDNTYSSLDLIRPGAVIPYKAYMDNPPASWAKIEVEIQADPASNYEKANAYLDLAIEQPSVVLPKETYDSLKIIGRVKNTGSKTAQLVEIAAVIYDATGKITDVDTTFAKLDKIAPGATSTFEISTYGVKTAEKYDLIVSGRVAP